MRIAAAILVAVVPSFAILYNVDQPVPISLAHGEYFTSVRLWGSGGVMARLAVGLFNRLTLGMSYGGDSIIGSARPAFFDRYRPDFQARLAILEEQGHIPNLVLGYETQGYDGCVNKEYQVREKGGYLCVGKTIDASRTFCQLGVNYWQGTDGFLAVNQLFPGNVEAIVEYDPALNQHIEHNKGFLNFGLAWTFNEKLRLAAALRDILRNRPETKLDRVLELSINEHF
jgi:hypothetical protein